MAKNTGKIFEDDFKNSVPDYCLLHRLKDTAQAYNNSKATQFTWNNPCDFFMFDTVKCIFYCFELKSTQGKSMSFEDIETENPKKRMIHKHQILSLLEFSKYNNVFSGFIFNFRDQKNTMQRAYCQDIKSFMNMCKTIGKHSFNEMDLILNGAVKINGNKKRVHYTWNIDKFLNDNKIN